jgi:hypothetical protein
VKSGFGQLYREERTETLCWLYDKIWALSEKL